MKKAAIIFLLAVILPAFLLGYLSLQSARQQEVLIESQEARLRQQQVDVMAGQVALAVRVEHENFINQVKVIMSSRSLDEVAAEFNPLLQKNWDRKSVGFSVRESGGILSPRSQRLEMPPAELTEKFILENAQFLQGAVEADVYATSNDSLQDVQQELVMKQQASYFSKSKIVADKKEQAVSEPQSRSRQSNEAQSQQSSLVQLKRNVIPQRYDLDENKKQLQPDSTLNVARSTFKDLTMGKESGIVTRFVDDRLEMLFWMRPESGSNYIFGARVLPENLQDVVEKVIDQSGLDADEIIAAVLDDRTRPFAVYPQGERSATFSWSQPFVASEIGEMLPHWEVGLYLVNPARLTQAAQISSWTISGLILISLVAIAGGGSLLLLDTRRQLDLVGKKTDFVSNVSHELKTPLTSIRMFAELLREKRVQDEDKVDRYLDIITVEAERLTRLINNVLDFSRMERNQKSYHKEPLDLYGLLETVWSGQELHLQQEGFITRWHAQDGPYPVTADADAMAQVLVNLISNAEKYSDSTREIELHSYLVEGEVRISVMDRGIGVPAGDEKKIFEHFYRAHDSLANGIQGSGLGLTLAARIATDHGGCITFERRDGGGSRFSLQLPLRDEFAA
jgi:signal transduction histidine kinase